MTGTYPNPSLATTGPGAITKGTASRSATITLDAKGRVVALTDSAIASSGDFFNIKSYGAVGDGTTDDTASINAAIAALNAAGGGCLYLPAGVYKITSQPTTITTDVKIMGDGVQVVQVNLNSCSGFKIDQSSHANYRSATACDFSTSVQSGHASGLVGLEYIPPVFAAADKKIEFSNLFFYDLGKCIFVNSSTVNGVAYGRIEGCCCHSPVNLAINLYGFHIKNSTQIKIIGCAIDSYDTGVYVEGNCEGTYMTGTDVIGCDKGFVQYCVGASVHSDTSIVDCFFDCLGTIGVKIGDATSGVPNSSIVGCSFAGGGASCLCLELYGDDSTVTGCNFWNAAKAGSITIYGANNVVSGCNVQNIAIKLAATSSNCRVSGCAYANITGARVIDSGTNNVAGDTLGLQKVANLTGGAATEDINVDITAIGLGKLSSSAYVSIGGAHFGSKIVGGYDATNGANTSINARFTLWMSDGTNLPAGNHRFNVLVSP